MRRQTNKKIIQEILFPYLENFPTTPNLTLAKRVYKDHPMMFKDTEHVRDLIRNHRGKHGDRLRKQITNKTFMENYKPVFQLPEPYHEDWTPFHISKKYRNILVMSDLHIPYHDPQAIKIAVEWGQRHEVDCVILNGDIVDFYGVSKFGHEPGRPTPRQELDALYQFLQWLSQEMPVKIYYKDGNHEERFMHWLRDKCYEAYDVIEWHKEKLYDYAALDIEMIADQRIIMAGKLPILHGHELKINGIAVNPARSAFLKTYKSCLVGHSHRTSEHSETDMSEEIITTWSTGCLCYTHPEYARINKWNLGFSRVKIEDDGNYKVTNLRIYNGEVL